MNDNDVLQERPELVDGDPGLEKNRLKRLWRKDLFRVHGNGDDDVTLRMIEIVMAAPGCQPPQNRLS